MIGDAMRRIRRIGLSRKMRRDWDRRARRNALHFVNTAREDWQEDAFFKTGEQNVRDQILSDLDSICRGRKPESMSVLEIGCGVGRMTRALASTFGEVQGVDVSPEMVRRARDYLRSTRNVRVDQNSGRDLRQLGDRQFDFAFSFIVFQHIPSRKIIDGYVGEVSRVLRPGSLFKFQVQGHRDAGSHEPRRNTWLGASVSDAEAEEMAARHGFEFERSEGSGTQYFWLWFRKI